jgi:uroporphyrinogen decarboxylase
LVDETPEQVEARVNAMVDEMRGRDGYIFNLGHGLLPATKLQNVEAVIDAIRGYEQ